MTTLQENPEVRALTTSVSETVAGIMAFAVASNDDYSEAGALLLQIKTRKNAIEDQRKKLTRPLDESKKGIMDFFRPVENQLATAETRLRNQMLGFRQEQQRIADAEAAKARDAAEKQRARDIAAADKLEARGKTEEADARRFEAETSVARFDPALEMPSAAGISTRETWKAEVYNLPDLIRAVADSKAPSATLMADQRALDNLAKALKEQMNIPGVRAVRSESVVARA